MPNPAIAIPISFELTQWAKAYESTAQAYCIALTEASGGLVVHQDDFTLTLVPDRPGISGVISPRFSDENALQRIETILGAVQPHRQDMRFKLGPSTQPATLALILEKRGLKKSYTLHYMACPLCRFKTGFSTPVGLSIHPLEDYEVLYQLPHPYYGRKPSSRKRRRLAAFQALSQQYPRQHWLFVAERAGEIIGTSVIFLHQDNVGIYDFVTFEPFRRQGIGAAMLAGVCDFAQGQGVHLAVLVASGQGARFYPRFGFEPVGHYPSYLYSKDMQRKDNLLGNEQERDAIQLSGAKWT